MRCLTCQYDLRHLSEHRCPECGRAFDPNDPRTFTLPRMFDPDAIPTLHLLLMLLVSYGIPFILCAITFNGNGLPGHTAKILYAGLWGLILCPILFAFVYISYCALSAMMRLASRGR